MKIDLTEVSVVPTDVMIDDHDFDGCASVDCPFYWGEWSMGTPDYPSEFDCGCTYEPFGDTFSYRFVDGGADGGCPVLALVRIARILGVGEELDDLNEIWKHPSLSDSKEEVKL